MNYKHLLTTFCIVSFSLCCLLNANVFAADKKTKKTPSEIKVNTNVPATCSIFSRGLDKELDKSEPIAKIVKELIKALQTKNSDLLEPLMHPRLKMDKAKIKVRILEEYGSSIYYPVSSFNLYRVWKIDNPSEQVKPVPCNEDNLTIAPHYGYKQQYSVLISIMGAKELGRIYTSIVPVKDKWYLGSFDTKQWTLDGKDWQAWTTSASHDFDNNQKVQAYLKMDIANKLLSPTSYISYTQAPQLQTLKQQMFPQDILTSTIKELLPKLDIVATSALFAVGGIGVLVRYKVQPTDEAVTLSSDCKNISSILLKNPNFSNNVGIRCSFILDKEDPLKDGLKGSIYYDKDVIIKK